MERESFFHLQDAEEWKRTERSEETVRRYSSCGSHATPSTKWSCPRMHACVFSWRLTEKTEAVLSTEAEAMNCEQYDQARSHTSSV